MAFFWMLLGLLTRIEGALLSPVRPMTSLEQGMPIWPPSPPLSAWLERVLISPWVRWDAFWYIRIVEQGYRAGDGTTQFYPLYPLLALPLARLGLSPAQALTLVSVGAGLGAVLLLEQMACLILSPARARAALLLFLLFPVAFVLFAPYSEALFLLAAVGSFWALRRERWWPAALAAGLAALARPQGLLLLLPLGWAMVRRSVRFAQAVSLMLPVLMLVGWHAYRMGVLEGFQPAGRSLNAWLYALFLSPYATRVVPYQAFLWPWEALWRGVAHFLRSPDLDMALNLILGGWFLFLFTLAWPRMDGEERLYSLAVTLVAFSYHTGPAHPYMGLVRHLWVAFPVFLALGHLPPRLLRALILIQAPAFFFAVIPYILDAWVI